MLEQRPVHGNWLDGSRQCVCELGAVMTANGLDSGCGRNASHQRVTVPRAPCESLQLAGQIGYRAHGKGRTWLSRQVCACLTVYRECVHFSQTCLLGLDLSHG